MNKIYFCFTVYNPEKDLFGVPFMLNGMMLVDVGEMYNFVYTDKWRSVGFT